MLILFLDVDYLPLVDAVLAVDATIPDHSRQLY